MHTTHRPTTCIYTPHTHTPTHPGTGIPAQRALLLAVQGSCDSPLCCVLQCLGKRTVRKTNQLMSMSTWFVSAVAAEAGPASLSLRASFDVTTDQVPVALRRLGQQAGSELCLLYARRERGASGPGWGAVEDQQDAVDPPGVQVGSRAG